MDKNKMDNNKSDFAAGINRYLDIQEIQEISDKGTKQLLSAINEFCKNVDPTKYVLCQKLDFVDGFNRFWFEVKE